MVVSVNRLLNEYNDDDITSKYVAAESLSGDSCRRCDIALDRPICVALIAQAIQQQRQP